MDSKRLIVYCEDIIKRGKLIGTEETWDVLEGVKIMSEIENIYFLFYPNGIPRHLTEAQFNDYDNKLHITGNFQPWFMFLLVLGKFEAFYNHIRSGMLRKLSNIISVDLYSDLIDQAKELRNYNTESLNRAACVLGRIVLEDSLKKICSNNKLTTKSDGASQYNIELKKNLIYSKVEWKNVEFLLSIGNAAAHPKQSGLDFFTIEEKKMDDFLNGVKDFSEKYLG